MKDESHNFQPFSEAFAAFSLERLGSVAAKNGLELTPGQIELLGRYAQLLKAWNQRINLLSRKDEENILTRHVLHSLTLAMPEVAGVTLTKGARLLDLGTGGGLPGIPLKIARLDLDMTLCDSIQKKITADMSMISALGLSGIRAITSRAEALKKHDPSAQYQSVVTRAVAPLDELIQWTDGLIVGVGQLYALKGGDLGEEIATAQRLRAVERIEVQPLALKGFEEFVREEKKLIIVHLR